MQQQFTGLTMPVFTAFGWAGEEQALNFALSQLEQFIASLHASLSRRAQNHLPFFGLNAENRVVYLSAAQDAEQDVHLSFITRPASLELQLAVTEQMAIGKAMKAAESDSKRWMQLLQDLEGEWTLHIKQMELDDESEERTSYQDLFKDTVDALDEEEAQSVASRTNFLNGEPQWVTPFTLSRRFPAEQVATMGTDIVPFMAEQVKALMPFFEFITGRAVKARTTKAKKAKPKPAARREERMDPDKQFVYVTALKPLHIRRGFINLTPDHWDFFAQSARDTTRDVTVNFEDRVDTSSSVWHLTSNNMARIVLSEPVRDWLADTFDPEDNIQVTATKLDDDQIEVMLEPVE